MKWFTKMRERMEARATKKMEQMAASADASAPTDTRTIYVWGVRALWAGAVVLVMWVGLAPLEQGTPAQGYVKVDGSRKTVQHARGGNVDAILVKEGDVVVTGQPLIRLNEAQAQSQQGSIDAQLYALLVLQARLQAERTGGAGLQISPEVQGMMHLPQVKDALETQTRLFNSRKAALEAEIAINQESIVGVEQQIKGMQAQEASRARQQQSYEEELASLKPMYEQGFVPRNRMFELERSIAYLTGQRSEDLTNMARGRSQISELRLKNLQAKDTFRKEVETQLADAQRQISDLRERRLATQDELSRVVIKSPADGTVVEMSVATVGGVIAPGQKLMDIVPRDVSLVVEVNIPPHLIDNVHVGQEADVHFLSLDQTMVPPIKGTLVYLGADRQTDPRTDQSYFVGRIKPNPDQLRKLGTSKMHPGMPADAVIKTGEHTLFFYLVKPLVNRMRSAMVER